MANTVYANKVLEAKAKEENLQDNADSLILKYSVLQINLFKC